MPARSEGPEGAQPCDLQIDYPAGVQSCTMFGGCRIAPLDGEGSNMDITLSSVAMHSVFLLLIVCALRDGAISDGKALL